MPLPPLLPPAPSPPPGERPASLTAAPGPAKPAGWPRFPLSPDASPTCSFHFFGRFPCPCFCVPDSGAWLLTLTLAFGVRRGSTELSEILIVLMPLASRFPDPRPCPLTLDPCLWEEACGITSDPRLTRRPRPPPTDASARPRPARASACTARGRGAGGLSVGGWPGHACPPLHYGKAAPASHPPFPSPSSGPRTGLGGIQRWTTHRTH